MIERINNEGGKDEIFECELEPKELESNLGECVLSEDDRIFRTQYRLCKYAFDTILIDSYVNWLGEYGSEGTVDLLCNFELKTEGSYYGSNDKGFVDLFQNEFYGPRVPYEENYPYDYFVLTDSE